MYGGTASWPCITQAGLGLSPRVRGNPTLANLLLAGPRSIPACTGEPAQYVRRQRRPAVYPRVYGGTAVECPATYADEGLSPRVRGNLPCAVQQDAAAGSIPACTGEPEPDGIDGTVLRVYPRVYGGTSLAQTEIDPHSGLSPRVRGNPPGCAGAGIPGRSIPACTGEPWVRAGVWCKSGVYPRVYGGTRCFAQQANPRRGLSPRVRGNRTWNAIGTNAWRSIPACTGEPRAHRPPVGTCSVYPRVYGGTVPDGLNRNDMAGLSPRVRGNRWRPARPPAPSGSIPACTGEPSWRIRSTAVQEVYPRVYGGTTGDRNSIAQVVGLSPRVRGNLVSGQAVGVVSGSIPACTGEPVGYLMGLGIVMVYPRVYGGTCGSSSGSIIGSGLSPRVRGNQRRPAEPIDHARSIPACTGEPHDRRLSVDTHRVYPRVYGGTEATAPSIRRCWGLSPRVRGNHHRAGHPPNRRRSIPACTGEPRGSPGIVTVEPVYPRVYGGTLTQPSACSLSWGLSPRVRGNRRHHHRWGVS